MQQIKRVWKKHRDGVSMIWSGISLTGHTGLHVFRLESLSVVRYRDVILDQYVGE